MEKIPTDTWIVVADGRGARLFRNVGTDIAPKLHQEDTLDLRDPENSGPSASPVDASPKQVDEATFAKQLAHQINAAALKNEFAHIVLFADPTTLGRMRPLLHKETQSRLLREIGKDLTNSPVADIERSLGAAG